jgi:hypothetical protein
MNQSSGPDWQPDPQLLAAYFDGELEGRDDIGDLRARLEIWLENHPEALDEWAEHKRLQNLWLGTTPAEPAAGWNQTLDQIAARRRLPGRAGRRRPWLAVGIIAASVAVLVGLLVAGWRMLTPPAVENNMPIANVAKGQPKAEEELEVFPVATADEIIVRRIDGADTGLLASARFPVEGPLELAKPGDVRVFFVGRDPADRMMATGMEGGSHVPMIYAKLDTED